MQITFTLNHKKVTAEIAADTVLLDLVRSLGCKSVKRGCETANCGLCTVFLDEKPVLSCSVLAARVNGRSVTTLEGLADYGGFSRSTLSRMFSRHTGATFIQYLNARRVDMAAEMLSQSDLPVTQVALRVGFGSIATFNRVFRTQKGCTPSQYRNVYLELKK